MHTHNWQLGRISKHKIGPDPQLVQGNYANGGITINNKNWGSQSKPNKNFNKGLRK